MEMWRNTTFVRLYDVLDGQIFGELRGVPDYPRDNLNKRILL
jgi:hypothetical protein